MYLSCSAAGFIIIILRRVIVHGELGGSPAGRYGSALIFFTLWLLYVVIAGLGFYGVIEYGA
jgi:hypothetical protein